MSNFRKYPRGRPQSGQRLRCRTGNFGVLRLLAKCDSLDIIYPASRFTRPLRPASASYVLNGTPRCRSSERASSSVVALVTNVMFIPRILSTLA